MTNDIKYYFCSTGYDNIVSTLMPAEIKQTLIATRYVSRYELNYVIIYDRTVCKSNCTIAENLTAQDITVLKLKRDIFIAEITDPFLGSYLYGGYTVLPNIPYTILTEQCRKHFGFE